MPDSDAQVLEANGWTLSSTGGVTTTIGRPTTPLRNMRIIDSVLGYHIVFDGKVWRNPVTGVVV